ncbi:MAG: ABC transporter permease subunit, partial [Gammaproteobacteria bacterium]|nr:ABC transporter permease subunit [Gammaproteobacteria bacterium]
MLEYQGQLLSGTWVTIKLALLSLLFAVFFGLIGAGAKLSKNIVAQKIAGAYTMIVRGVPDLVLILLVFFGGQEL